MEQYLSLFQQVTKSRYISPFFGGGNTLNLLINHLQPITLHFKNKDLERHYYAFVNENSAFYIGIGGFLGALLFLVYIPLDASYDKFTSLLLDRTLTAAFLFVSLVALTLSIQIRRHCVHITSIFFIVGIVSGMASLILRDDTGFSPLFMVLLWGNLHYSAFAIWRTITTTLLIITHALVWILYLDKDTEEFLTNQTLSYILFYIGTVVTAYGREIGHRRVYLQIHDMLKAHEELKRYTVMLSSSTKSLLVNSKSRNSVAIKSPSLSPNNNNSLATSSEIPIFVAPASQTATLEVSDHPNFLPNTPSFDNPHSPTLIKPDPNGDYYFRTSSDIYGAVQDNFGKFMDQLKAVFDMCLPSSARGESLMADVGYHRAVFLYVGKLSHRVSLKFRDSAREARFLEWHTLDSSPSVRRFMILNIISIISMVTHDLHIKGLAHSEESVLLILRFGVIISSLVISLIISLFPQSLKWRNIVSTVLELICAGTSLAMALYSYNVLKTRIPAEIAVTITYDLYFGYMVRFVVYGFCGNGLLWINSTATAAVVVIAMFVSTALLEVPLALTPLLLVLIGFTISYNEEKARRVEFYLQYFSEEILTYIRAKEQTEESSQSTTEEVKPF